MRLERRGKFAIVALETGLAIHRGLGADEAQVRVAQRDAIVGMPAAQHGPVDLGGDGAQRGAHPDPARWGVADPGLGVRLLKVFDADATELVRKIMVLRCGHGVGLVAQTQLLKTGQEPFQVLAAKQLKNELFREPRVTPAQNRQHQAGDPGVIEACQRLHGTRVGIRVGHV